VSTPAARPQLTAEKREVTGKAVAQLRREGLLPAVVYGRGVDSESLQVDARAFELLRRQAGRNALVDLHVGNGQARPVLVHSIQEHPVSRKPLHIDFFVVRMTEELTVDVRIVTVGLSEAVDKLGGTLLHLFDSIKVRALPADLPQSVELDVTPLATFDDQLHVSDIPLPPNVTLVTDLTEVVAKVQPPRIEEEPVVAAEVAEGEEGVEGAEAAAEGEEGAEGAEGAGGAGEGRGEGRPTETGSDEG
jgi:large subunit ribosomal protein L25